jgi:hypothetical protein
VLSRRHEHGSGRGSGLVEGSLELVTQDPCMFQVMLAGVVWFVGHAQGSEAVPLLMTPSTAGLLVFGHIIVGCTAVMGSVGERVRATCSVGRVIVWLLESRDEATSLPGIT